MDNSPKANQILGKFNKQESAESFADHGVKLHAVILGDDQKFWVVNMRTFENLTKNGYEAI